MGKIQIKFALFSFALFVLYSDSSLNGQGDQHDVFSIVSPSDTYDWAIGEDSGRVFGSLTKGTEVVEWNVAMNSEVRRFEIGKPPRHLFVKNNFLVVACQGVASVVVVNLETNKVAGTVTLAGKSTSTLFGSKKEDGIVYVVTHKERQYDDPVIHMVDCNSLSSVGTLTESGNYRSDIVNAVMSDSGTAFVVDRRGYTSSSGGDVSLINANDGTFERLTQSRETYGVIQPGPANRFWCYGSKVMSFRDEKLIRNFGGHIMAVHRDLDLAVSLDVVAKSVSFWKFSNAKLLKKIAIPDLDNNLKSSRRPSWSFDNEIDDPVLSFDYKNHAVFCSMRKTAFLIPCREFEEKAKPLFLIEGQPQLVARTGKQLKLPLELSNSSLSKNAKFELVSGPESANLNGNVLAWTPTPADVGDITFQIKATSGEQKDTLSLPVSVSGFQIKLGIMPQSWHVSPSGKYAAVWGKKLEKNSRQSGPSYQNGAEDIVIVDLENEKVIARQKLTKPIKFLTISDTSYYVFGQNSNVMYKVNINDVEDRKRMFLPGQALWAEFHDDEKLVVGCHNEKNSSRQKQQIVLDPDTMKILTDDPRCDLGNQSFGVSTGKFSPAGKNRASDGLHIYDTTTGKVVTILTGYNLGFPPIDSQALRGFASYSGSSSPPTKMWGRTIDRAGLTDGSGNRIAQIKYPFEVSTDFPIGVGFASTQKSSGRNVESTGTFSFYDLVEGSVLQTQMAFKTTASNSFGSGFGSYNSQFSKPLVIRGKMAQILFQDSIFQVEIPETVIMSAKKPFAMTHPEVVTVDLTKPTIEIDFKCPGYEKVSYSMKNSIADVELDEGTGKLTILGSKIWSKKLPELSSNLSRPSIARASFSQNQSQNLIEASRKKYGIPQGKMGIVIPLTITATSEDGQTDQLQFCIIGLGDRKIIDEQNAKLLAQQMKQQEELRQRREAALIEQQKMAERRAIEEKNATIKREAGSQTDERIVELEKRIKRLEAVIDTLIDKIEKLQKDD